MRWLRVNLLLVSAFVPAHLLAAGAHAQDPRSFPIYRPNPQQLRDVPGLADLLTDRVRELGATIDAELGRNVRAQYLASDVAELAQASDEFAAVARGQLDLRGLRRSYGGITLGWQQIQDQLAGLNRRTRGVDRAAERVSEVEARLAGLLGLSQSVPVDPDPGLPGFGPIGEARRLSDTLAVRASSLASSARYDRVGLPGGNRLAREADELARATEAYRGLLYQGGLQPADLRYGFESVASRTERVAGEMARLPAIPPLVASSWSSYRSAYDLAAQQVGTGPIYPDPPGGGGFLPLPVPVPLPVRPPRPIPTPVPVSPRVEQLAGVLVDQAEAFLQVFAATSAKVPERQQFLAESSRLRDSAVGFLQAVQSGLDPGQLSGRFREVDANYQRLARRTYRVAKGQTGPNIQQVGLMGRTIADLGQILAYPFELPPGLIR